MKIRVLILSIIALAAVSCTQPGGGGIDRPSGGSSTDEAIIGYIDQRLMEEYYWLDEVHQKSNLFNRRVEWEDYLHSSLLMLTTNEDDGYYNNRGQRAFYSFIRESPAETRAEAMGYGLVLHYTILAMDDTRLGIVVEYTYPDSPAERCGVRRGDIIVKYNNADITRDNYISVFNTLVQGEGAQARLMLQRQAVEEGESDTFNVVVERAAYEESPVVYSNVFTEGDTRLGYLVYTAFDKDYDDALLDVFREFEAEGVNKLILDLRCNSGGDVVSAVNLVSAILGAEYVGELLCEVRRNPLNKKFSPSTTFCLEDVGVGLNLREVVVICSENSASASEMVVVGLRGLDIPVKLIGNQTEGKNCGMDVMYRTINSVRVEYAPITFMCYNAKGFGDYGEGIIPDIDITVQNTLGITDERYPLPRAGWASREDAAYVAALVAATDAQPTRAMEFSMQDVGEDEITLPRPLVGTRIVVEE